MCSPKNGTLAPPEAPASRASGFLRAGSAPDHQTLSAKSRPFSTRWRQHTEREYFPRNLVFVKAGPIRVVSDSLSAQLNSPLRRMGKQGRPSFLHPLTAVATGCVGAIFHRRRPGRILIVVWIQASLVLFRDFPTSHARSKLYVQKPAVFALCNL